MCRPSEQVRRLRHERRVRPLPRSSHWTSTLISSTIKKSLSFRTSLPNRTCNWRRSCTASRCFDAILPNCATKHVACHSACTRLLLSCIICSHWRPIKVSSSSVRASFDLPRSSHALLSFSIGFSHRFRSSRGAEADLLVDTSLLLIRAMCCFLCIEEIKL